MRIVLNGRTHDGPDDMTISALLETIGLASGPVAVEVNGRVVPRIGFAGLTLRLDDRVEVVHFVGGG